MARSAFNPFRRAQPVAVSSSQAQNETDNPFADGRDQKEPQASGSTPTAPSVESGAQASTSAQRLPSRTPSPVDKPPEYTPSPDVWHGERLLEAGPSRPFQSVQPQPTGPPIHPQRTGWSNVHSQFGPQQDRWAQVTSQATGQAPPLPPRNPNQQQPAGDGRPTTRPVSGHPLLNSGRLLVYPRGYTCPKCARSIHVFF